MPRETSFTPELLADRALEHFWEHGFHASSMEDLVKATGVSRHGIYGTFGGKKALFLACFDRYQSVVVTPAFEVVEAEDADLDSIETYFATQIARGEALGLPGPGCFVANSATEVAPADAEVMAKVRHHNQRLRGGFERVLERTYDGPEVEALADILVVFTNGLWTMSRSVSDARPLRRAAQSFLGLVRGRMQ